jgi:hypothetical protein
VAFPKEHEEQGGAKKDVDEKEIVESYTSNETNRFGQPALCLDLHVIGENQERCVIQIPKGKTGG